MGILTHPDASSVRAPGCPPPRPPRGAPSPCHHGSSGAAPTSEARQPFTGWGGSGLSGQQEWGPQAPGGRVAGSSLVPGPTLSFPGAPGGLEGPPRPGRVWEQRSVGTAWGTAWGAARPQRVVLTSGDGVSRQSPPAPVPRPGATRATLLCPGPAQGPEWEVSLSGVTVSHHASRRAAPDLSHPSGCLPEGRSSPASGTKRAQHRVDWHCPPASPVEGPAADRSVPTNARPQLPWADHGPTWSCHSSARAEGPVAKVTWLECDPGQCVTQPPPTPPTAGRPHPSIHTCHPG